MVVICLLLAVSSLAGVLYQTDDVPNDETVTRLDVDGEADAVFVLEVRTILDTDDKRDAFDAFADEVEQDPEGAVSDFRDSVEPLLERTGDETGREMSASNFTVETRKEPLPVERGVVEYRFVWNGFAHEDGDTDGLRAGDVLSGYILGEDDALAVRAPDGYVVSSAEPAPDTTGEEARWNGPYDFADDEPRVFFAPEAPDDTDSEPTDSQDGDGSDDGDGGSRDATGTDTDEAGVPLYVYAVVLVAVISVAAVVYHRRAGTEEAAEPDAPQEETQTQEPSEEEAEEEPVSDDERVLRMIESEGGRMKQKHIVEETGWSEAKVSKLTSEMEDEGAIAKIRLGRENSTSADAQEGMSAFLEKRTPNWQDK